MMEVTTVDRPSVIMVGPAWPEQKALREILYETFDLCLFDDVQQACRAVSRTECPKLVLVYTGVDPLESERILGALRQDERNQDVPLICFGWHTDEQLGRLYRLGATGHISLPTPPRVVASIVHAQLSAYAQLVCARQINSNLERQMAKRSRDVLAAQEATFLAMVSLAGSRDSETGAHILRTQHYIASLCRYLRRMERYASVLTDATIDRIFKSAPLHDIGKVGIPDSILLKPGRLTAEEFTIMKTHPALGKRAIDWAEAQLGVQLEFLDVAKQIAFSHHEKWDGSGYPQGLVGEEIPLPARLMAIADVYDALISRRVYKKAHSHEQAVQLIQQGSGTHFDPTLVDAFTAIQATFLEISERFRDADELDSHEGDDRVAQCSTRTRLHA
jgi:putative two-component system response regulator